MEFLLTFFLVIFIFGFLVFIHEFGHFIVAKWNGVQVDEFAFGFGPKIFGKKFKGTYYRVNIFPLGGYVKMLGDEDASSFVSDQSLASNPKSYPAKKIWQKMSIILAGPAVNFVGAVIIFYIVLAAISFKPDPIAKLVNYNFIGANQKEVLLYNFVDENSPFAEEDIPFVGFVGEINGIQPENYSQIEELTDAEQITVEIYDIDHSVSEISLAQEDLFDGSNPLGLELIDSQTLDRVGYEGTGVFYNGVIANSPLERADVPEAGFFTGINGEDISSADQLNSLIDENLGSTVELEILDLNFEESAYEVELTSPRDDYEGMFYTSLTPDGAAKGADLPESGFLVSIEGQEIGDIEKLREVLNEYESQTVDVEVATIDGQSDTYQVQLGEKEEDRVFIGIFFGEPTNNYVSFGTVFSELPRLHENFFIIDYSGSKLISGFLHSINVTLYQILGLGQLIADAFGGNPALLAESVGTPIKVGEVIYANVSSNGGIIDKAFLINILNITGLLSATLAFMNMIPIPLVDGGQFYLLVLEKLRGRPLSQKKQEVLGRIGFIFLVGLSIVVILKDFWQVILSRLF